MAGESVQLINYNVVPMLSDCCEHHLLAVISSPANGAAVSATFSALHDDAVEFDVRGQVHAAFDALASTVVSFQRRSITYVFSGSVVFFLPAPTSGIMRLTLPPFIVQPELRRFYRVPIVEPGRVQVVVEDRGYTYEPSLLDLSAGGMLVAFGANDDPQLVCNAPLHVKLGLDQYVSNYFAEVRHGATGKYGIEFMEPPDIAEALREGDSLKEILKELQAARAARLR